MWQSTSWLSPCNNICILQQIWMILQFAKRRLWELFVANLHIPVFHMALPTWKSCLLTCLLNTDPLYFSTIKFSNDVYLKESLKVNHNKFTRQNQSTLNSPLLNWKGKRSLFYFSAQLYNQFAWGLTDYPTRAFGGGTAACLWEEDRCAVHWARLWCCISATKLDFFYYRPGSSQL